MADTRQATEEFQNRSRNLGNEAMAKMVRTALADDFKQINQRFDQVDKRFDDLEQHIDRLDRVVGEEFIKINGRFDKVEGDIAEIKDAIKKLAKDDIPFDD